MNIWFVAATALVLAVLPCGFVLARESMLAGLVALQLSTAILVATLALFCVGAGRPSFLDIPLTLALLSYPATVLFAHFFERWL